MFGNKTTNILVLVISGEQAQGLLDPDVVANRLMEEWMP